MPYSPYQIQESRWQNYYSDSFTITRDNFYKGERHGIITIPGSLSQTYLRIYFVAENIPKHLYLAGWLNQYYSNDMIVGQLLESFKIPYNKPTIVQTNRFSEFYQLTFKPIERILRFQFFVDTLAL